MSTNTRLTYYKKKHVILNKAKDYYKNNKDRLSKQARDLPEQEKDKKKRIQKKSTLQYD